MKFTKIYVGELSKTQHYESFRYVVSLGAQMKTFRKWLTISMYCSRTHLSGSIH